MLEDISSLRAVAVTALFLVLAGLESIRPALTLSGDLGARWVSHIGLYALNIFLAFGLGAIGLSGLNPAILADSLHLFSALAAGWPIWAQILCAVLALDLFAYGTHRLFHRVPLLWVLHGVHHADADMDATTSFRHHPGEVGAMALCGLVFSLVLGIPAVFWALYALLAQAIALAHHANLRLPETLDRVLRILLVTPGMHRHHHAVARAIHDRNYGSLLSVWDRIFATYHTSSATERDSQPVGLEGLGGPADQRLDGALLMPLRLFSRNSP